MIKLFTAQLQSLSQSETLIFVGHFTDRDQANRAAEEDRLGRGDCYGWQSEVVEGEIYESFDEYLGRFQGDKLGRAKEKLTPEEWQLIDDHFRGR